MRGCVFLTEQMKEIRYAALLHDFGKVGVREDVLVKAKKLYPLQMEVIRTASITYAAHRRPVGARSAVPAGEREGRICEAAAPFERELEKE